MLSNVQFQPKTQFKGTAAAQNAAVPAMDRQVDAAPLHPLNAPAALHFKAQIAPQIKTSPIRFGHALTDDDYLVSHRVRVPVNAYSVSKTLRAAVLCDLAKREQDDSSTLKYALSAYASNWDEDEAALADNLVLVDRDVDTVIQGHAGPASVYALMMTRMMNGDGRRFMSKDATLSLGPVMMYVLGKNHDQQTVREMANENIRDKESLIMLASGETDRTKIYKELNSDNDLNALQALAFGKYGLVDAILVGTDQVLTRKGLDKFYAAKKFDAKQIEEFNKDPLNIDQIINNVTFRKFLVPLSEYSQAAVVPPVAQRDKNRVGQYLSFKDNLKPKLKNGSDQQLEATKDLTAKGLQIFARPLDDPDFKGMKRIPFLTAQIEAYPDMPSQIQLRGALPASGLVYDDLITFNDGFDDTTAQQIHQALVSLDKKKSAQKDPSHIKILINSPGGSMWSGQELRSAIAERKTPVDVIVSGMAASCGSYLLSSATGNRFALPNARIMIHQAASGHVGTNQLVNQGVDGTQAATEKYAASVAKASGRSLSAVLKDFRQDTWLNPLESMFYGPKGLVDAIMVAPDKAITREEVLDYLNNDPEVQAYLTEKFGTKDNVKKYLDHRLRQLREPNRIHNPEEWEAAKGKDPFDNPLRTIMAAAAKAKPLADHPKLKGSATRPQEVIDQFVVGRKPMLMRGFGDGMDMSAQPALGRNKPQADPFATGQAGRFALEGLSPYEELRY